MWELRVNCVELGDRVYVEQNTGIDPLDQNSSEGKELG
jgi:hypothetical protein